MAELYSCPDCGRENAADQRFCTSCGSSLFRSCPTCSHTNPPAAKFCGNCGTALAEAPPARSGEERRDATVLFADISGFTNLSRDRDPEDLKRMVAACMDKLGGIVERYDGFIDKVIGDALMAVFGVPVAHGDDPERAVRAALEMQRCAVENSEIFGDELNLSIGVNTGEVFFAPVGPDTRQTVMGAAVNTAQRLQSGAGAGTVLVGDETRRVTGRSIAYEEAAPVRVKEGEEPVAAWRALAVKSAEEPSAEAAPMVGREHELEVLRGIWRRVAAERRPHLVTVTGPPGIGKTRLGAEFARAVEDEGCRPLRGRSLPYGETGGYGALIQQIKTVAGIYESDSVPAAREKLEMCVASLVPADAADVAAHLAALIGLAGEETIPDKQVLFLSVRRFVESLARERPTLLVLEDIHWANESLLELVEHLASRLREIPLLILALARAELFDVRPAWGGGLPAYSALSLEPLSEAKSRELARRLLEATTVAGGDAVAEQLGATAEGNPLFIEELAASLREQPTGAASGLPTTVRGIIAARLDALPAEERSLVLDASVIGRVFWRGALEGLGSANGRLSELLDSLEARDLIRREISSRIEGDEEYTFKHSLIREVAYGTLPKAVRPELHAAVARFIERAAGDRIAESAAILAHHWDEAGEPAKSVDYLLLAADQAARAWAKKEAFALYTRALEAMAEDDDRRGGVRLKRAVALVQAGDFVAAIPELDALTAELRGRELFEALHARFLATFWGLTDAQASRRLAADLHGLANELGDPQLVALALARQSAATAMDGQVEQALQLGERGLAGWAENYRPSDLAEVLEWHSIHHYWLGRFERGIEPAQRAVAIGREVHSVAGLINGHGDLGLVLTGLGRHEEALASFERGAAYGRELELQPRFTARLVNMWAGTLRELYELDESRRLNEEAIEAGRRAGFAGAVVSGQIDLVFSDLLVGDVGRAEVALPRLAEAATETKGWHQWLWTTRIAQARAEVELAAERYESAADEARRAVETAALYGRKKYVTSARVVLGSALLELGRREVAVDVLRQALADARAIGHPPSIWRAAAKLGDALAALRDEDGAAAAVATARRTLDAFAAGLSEERRARFLQAPQPADILALAQ